MKLINSRSIIYNRSFDLRFSDFGIEIPIVDNRAKLVFESMQKIEPELIETNTSDVPKISKFDLELVHNLDYVKKLFESYRSLELEMLNAYELIDNAGQFHRYNPTNAVLNFEHAREIILKQVGATYLACSRAIELGFSYFLGGGMHHAMTFSGRGFCLVNDIMISIAKLLNENKIKSAWVIDVDAHKGDGTAEIVFKKSEQFKNVKTFSLHMKEGWPLNSGSVRDPWFIPSHIDLGIEEGLESQYLNLLQSGLNELEKFEKPDLCIIVNGADPYEEDALESTHLLKISKKDLLTRDKMIFNFLLDKKIPQAYLMAGGYGEKSHEIYEQFLKFVWERSS